MKGTEYIVSLYTGVVTTEDYNVTVNVEELIDPKEYLSLYTEYRIIHCRYNRAV
jgi:hypothetical protein